MARFLLYAIPAIVVLYALIDALQTPSGLARTLPKPLWLVVIILVPLLGAIAWLIWGRAPREAYGASDSPTTSRLFGRGRGPVAPDDDPRFLRQLDDEAWQRKMRERRDGQTPGDTPGLRRALSRRRGRLRRGTQRPGGPAPASLPLPRCPYVRLSRPPEPARLSRPEPP